MTVKELLAGLIAVLKHDPELADASVVACTIAEPKGSIEPSIHLMGLATVCREDGSPALLSDDNAMPVRFLALIGKEVIKYDSQEN